MLTRLKRLLAPPDFSTEAERERLTRLVNGVGMIWIAATALHFLVLRLLRPEALPAWWLVALALLVPGLALTVLRRGHIGLAGGILVAGTWFALLANATGGGVTAPVLPGLVLMILMVGTFLGWPAAAGLASISVLAGLSMQLALVIGRLSVPVTLRPWLEWASHLVFTAAAAVVAKLSIDTIALSLDQARAEVAARQRAEASLRERVEQLTMLHELEQVVLTTQSVRAMAQTAVNQMRRLVPCARAVVYLFDFAAGEAVPLAATPETEAGVTLSRLPLDAFGLPVVLQQTDPVYRVDDLLLAAPSSAYEADLRDAGLRSRLEAPLTIDAELAGSLSLIAPAPRAFSESHAKLAGQVADLLAIGIRQAQLLAEIRRHSDELEQRVTERTAQLATANDELADEISRRRQIQEQLKAANTQLTTWVGELEARTQEMAGVNELVAVLQACQAPAEAYIVVGQRMPGLFPGGSGGLSIIHPERPGLETTAQWGAADRLLSGFEPEDCWALRRGQPHLVLAGANDLPCAHWSRRPPASLCVPLLAKGEVLGCLHLEAAPGQLASHHQHLAKTVADALALTLAGLNLRERLRQQSIIDPLTGLFNRRYLEETLEREVRRSWRSGRGLAVILVDCDHFKDVNDRLGHAAGDQVLSELGRLFRAEIRAEDIACRYGGDEFVLILPDTPLAVATQRANRLLEAVHASKVAWEGQALGGMHLSLGVAAVPEHGQTGADVLRAADEALYAAKRQGRDRAVVADRYVGRPALAAAT
jgi:diguanylate cyclase (GGDEF)-like protein